ncbi:MAG TPA: methionyl-tRNA formyltransferase [Steroidobacteraceae bacterium]|nr:methionyl-tRNA formyltransferase [Steroidobacteraceae bacterium]
MRIAFAGTPAFAAVALQAIVEAGHHVPLVFTQPDRPAGRGMKPRACAVAELAMARGLPRLAPVSLRVERDGAPARQALERLAQAGPELMVVAAYGLILPQAMLDIPAGVALDAGAGRVRVVNIHASLLPRWRGAAPVARAIEAGDERTGVTLMQMQAGLDTGPMLSAEALAIDPADTAGRLTQRLAELGARMIVEALRHTSGWVARPQPAEGVTYARKIDRREAWIDWAMPAQLLARRVRAFDPDPGCCGRLDGAVIKVWSARAIEHDHGREPGTVLSAAADGLDVACGRHVLRIDELQRSGGRRMPARAFLAGTSIRPGARWDDPGEVHATR